MASNGSNRLALSKAQGTNEAEYARAVTSGAKEFAKYLSGNTMPAKTTGNKTQPAPKARKSNASTVH